MGDRSNIVIESPKYRKDKKTGEYAKAKKATNRVYLYSHWAGESIIASAVHGLKSDRAADDSYLARVIFSHMTREDADGTTTGYGISATITDNEYPILVIVPDSREVYFEKQSGYGTPFKPVTQRVPYAEFIAIAEGVETIAEMIDAMGRPTK